MNKFKLLIMSGMLSVALLAPAYASPTITTTTTPDSVTTYTSDSGIVATTPDEKAKTGADYYWWDNYSYKTHKVDNSVKTSDAFNGPYLGLGVGGSSATGNNVSGNNKNDLSFSYNGFGGYNYNFSGPWVAGVEGGVGNKDGQNYTLSADGKLGYKVRDLTMLYGKVGYADTNITEGGTYDYNGLRMGGGVETYLSQHVTARVEGIYTDYEARTVDNGGRVDPTDVGVHAGLSYLFN